MRWIFYTAIGVVILVALLLAFFQPHWLFDRSTFSSVLIWLAVSAGFLSTWILAGKILNLSYKREQAEIDLAAAEMALKETNKRLEALFSLSQKYVEARKEPEVIELLLQVSIDLVGAKGASYVPLDDYGQPLAAIARGDMPLPVMNAWVEYLASPGVRGKCSSCDQRDAQVGVCPLLKSPLGEGISTFESTGVYCLPLRCGDKEFGVLNLFMTGINQIEEETQAFLKAALDKTALAIESIRLRQQELHTIQKLQSVRQRRELNALLSSLLENVKENIKSDFVQLKLDKTDRSLFGDEVFVGPDPPQPDALLNSLSEGVINSGKPLLIGEVGSTPETAPCVRSIIAAPIIMIDNTVSGVLVAGRLNRARFNQRNLSFLQTIASQLAMVMQNANAMAEIEYQSVIQERTRLAREIHDGIAQTLGFLKLQAAKMRDYSRNEDIGRFHESLGLYYDTLSDAYDDARESIDDLRIDPSDKSVGELLSASLNNFSDLSGISVTLEGGRDAKTRLQPEINVQLIRIVQESLSNIRKHSQADHVWVDCRETGFDFCIEIRDNGKGYSPDDLIAGSQYGLQGMRERAELIGVDFQVISHPGEGTSVHLRLPMKDIEGAVTE